MNTITENAKAIVALVGSIATALLTVYGPDTEVGHVLTVIAVIATAVGTWAVPNQAVSASAGYFESEPGEHRRED
ncbi:hypothetical protein [Aeromicrobium piscarium]|uniref:Holin n=1 Tax=Aeromicrobium piscarium TaxID=2590901 RepID=A0A554SP53_9ACTN|nr:hypothetical protein [Aeromicrobium piscarium]TSD68145.1 hypothetical protein FNM00_00680 [Aeromicrobium piscarium]